MMKVVLDTNVIISSIFFGGNPRIIFEKIIRGEMQLVTSLPLLEELREVLVRKFKASPSYAQAICNELEALAQVVFPSQEVRVIKNDPADNQVLECAFEGKVKWIISGDSDLLTLQIWEGILIRSPAEFLETLE